MAPQSIPAVLQAPADKLGELRRAIQLEYADVAEQPEVGFHFHTGRNLTALLGCAEECLEAIPQESIEYFAGTGNPFSLGALRPGEHVVDVGCGAGLDSLVAARMVGPTGRVIGVDMTLAMLDKARGAAISAGLPNVDFREGFAEALPIEDGWADVVTSNGVPNLNRTGGCPVPGRVAKLATRSDETVLVFGPVDAHQDVSPARLRSSASWTRKLPQQGRNATPR